MTAQTDLEEKIHRQAQQIRRMQVTLEEKNYALDMLHYVWCDGGCTSGVHRFDGAGPSAITDAVIDTAVASLQALLNDGTLPRHLQHDAIRYIGRLITWRAAYGYKEAVANIRSAARSVLAGEE